MLTTEQLITRRKYLGGSEAPAVLGVDPWKNAYDIYLEKTCDIEPARASEAMDAGNRLEPVILDWASSEIGEPIIDRGRHCLAPDGILACTLDGRLSNGEIVQAKSSGMAEEFGEEGSDELPDRMLIQTHHEMYVTGAVVAWVPVLLGFRGLKFRMYRVERNDELADTVADKGRVFWNDHVLARKPPTALAPSLDILRRLKRVPSKVVGVDSELVQAWLDAKAARKAADEAAEEAQAKLLAAFGDADGARCGLGELTYFEQHRKAYECKASTFRVLRGPK